MTATQDGRRLRRIERENAQTPIETKPPWLKNTAVVGPHYRELKLMTVGRGLHTVCEEASCPNIYECWEDREATFLIGGSVCTRRCDFCDIATGRPTLLDVTEPRRVAVSVHELGLRYATVTSVSRDDLDDEGAWLNAETVRAIHALNQNTGVEILVSDFSGKPDCVQQVIDAKPEVFAHNLETVPRVMKKIRPAFGYERSLDVLNQASEAGMIVKSNLILGMGETESEILDAMYDLRYAGVHILTLTQYLRPSPLFHPIDRWVTPKAFVELAKKANEIGFEGVMAGPMVRSSYRAGRLWARTMKSLGREIPEHLSHISDAGTTLQEASSILARNGEGGCSGMH